MTARDNELEALSALMDGEATELELHRVLNTVSSDEALRSRWQRQQWVSQALSGRAPGLDSVDVSGRVREALTQPRPAARNPLWSVAVAASVTFAIVLGGQQLMVPADGDARPAVVSALGGGVVPVFGAQPVQASLETHSVNVPARQAFREPTPRSDFSPFYDQLVRDRYLQLGPVHAAASAGNHSAPFVPMVRSTEVVDPQAKR